MSYVKEIRKHVGNTPIILNSSGLLLQDSDNRILLVHRMDTNNWGLPGGYMELGETFKQTIIRELREELEVKPGALSLIDIFSGDEFYHEYPNGDKVYSVIALYKTGEFHGELKVDNNEINEAKFFDMHAPPTELTRTTKKILEYIKSL